MKKIHKSINILAPKLLVQLKMYLSIKNILISQIGTKVCISKRKFSYMHGKFPTVEMFFF